MAGIPLCCQQRPVPRTLRWHGVPFCVRAPQMETISSASVGRSVAVPLGPYFGSGLGEEDDVESASVSASSSDALLPAFAVAAVAAVGALGSSKRCTVRGGGCGRIARPSTSPMEKSAMAAIRGATMPALLKRPSQLEQKRRLVQTRQRERVIFSPHSAQKFGLYIKCKSLLCGKGRSIRTRSLRHMLKQSACARAARDEVVAPRRAD